MPDGDASKVDGEVVVVDLGCDAADDGEFGGGFGDDDDATDQPRRNGCAAGALGYVMAPIVVPGPDYDEGGSPRRAKAGVFCARRATESLELNASRDTLEEDSL